MGAASGDRHGLERLADGDVVAGVLVHQALCRVLRRFPVVDDAPWEMPRARVAPRAVAAGQKEPTSLVTYLPVRSYPELHPSTVRP
ncbi:hypothetical protein GCM10028833_05400 [Glycomyces tarimensis]